MKNWRLVGPEFHARFFPGKVSWVDETEIKSARGSTSPLSPKSTRIVLESNGIPAHKTLMLWVGIHFQKTCTSRRITGPPDIPGCSEALPLIARPSSWFDKWSAPFLLKTSLIWSTGLAWRIKIKNIDLCHSMCVCRGKNKRTHLFQANILARKLSPVLESCLSGA
jgi:hypothetical protein